MTKSKPCSGGDMWRRVEGCVDPATSARQPQGDLPCDVAPGIDAAGYCDCTTGPVAGQIPRHFGCGGAKRPCRAVCATPPPPSMLPTAFGEAVAADSPVPDAPEPWWRTPSVVVGAAVLVLLVVHHFTAPAQGERKKFERLVQAQRRQLAFERSLGR